MIIKFKFNKSKLSEVISETTINSDALKICVKNSKIIYQNKKNKELNYLVIYRLIVKKSKNEHFHKSIHKLAKLLKRKMKLKKDL